MYREEIEKYIDSHRGEMLEDIKTLCRINSEKMPYQEGMPYGEGACRALETALSMAVRYFGPSGRGSGGRGMDSDKAI